MALSLCVCVSALRVQPGYPSGSVRNDGTEYAAPWLNGQGIASEHGWIEVVESILYLSDSATLCRFTAPAHSPSAKFVQPVVLNKKKSVR